MNAVLPLPGPLARDPGPEIHALAGATGSTAHDVAEMMLDAALAGLPLGVWDSLILDWLTEKDIDVIVTVASLLRRSWLAGVATGRAELVDEAPAVQALRADVARLAVTVERAVRDMDELEAERDREEARSDFLRVELGQSQARVTSCRQALDAIGAAAAEAELAAGDETADTRCALKVLVAAVTAAIGGPR